ncbi:Putative acyl-CoA dehydrogenase FadE17 (plasmid) [Caballeronia sp. SBC1]|uniref:acyl-CoA dehydrogenase family protein n=1 Tax=unclassified Caballeronia TaxID=2646786 RepID=UPI0013E0F3DA|nr:MULTISPECIES: acyl-CoA dehydrogenase family protein [unclassified Caballeronia]QIE26822.1 Putative acyl-CoA dehydrogenase FadE17 [Caballeronia sp. SBC2]QIN63862.1 Putative acyl-CoA dehydrogenase FadE17 [Caballeronia sp. SBC1]
MNSETREQQLRIQVSGWMKTHLAGEFACLKYRGGPGDEEAYPALRKAWERELAAGGWTGLGWPAEAGGRALPVAEQVIFHEEYARAGGPGRMGHIGEGLLGPTLIACGTRSQRERFLPGILAGTQFWCQGYSEPGAGSDLANVRTRAVREADGAWRVAGQKVWTSLAHDSEWIFVIARTDPESRGNRGLSFLLMPLDQPGIEIRPIKQLNGGAEFNEVFFDGALAAADDLVGAPGDGWRIAMTLLGFERGMSTLGQQMQFIRELDWVIDTAHEAGVADDPAIRQRIARAWAGLRVMRYNALRMLAGADDASAALSREALIYKYYWSNWHRDLGQLAMDVLGPSANIVDTTDEKRTRLQGVFLFSRADTIYAGTNEIQLNIMAERGLGMPREPRGTL